MRCSKCGCNSRPDARFCGRCGAPLQQGWKFGSSAKPSVAESAPAAYPIPPKRERNKAAPTVAICLVLVVAVFTYYFVRGKSEHKTGSEIESASVETIQGALNGSIAGDGEYVFFAEPYYIPNKSPRLSRVSRIRPDGADYRNIFQGFSDDFIHQMMVAGDQVFVGMQNRIVGMDKDGGNYRDVVNADSSYGLADSSRFTVYKGRLYYGATNESGAWRVCSCGVDGADDVLVYQGTGEENVTGVDVMGVAKEHVLVTVDMRTEGMQHQNLLYSISIDSGDAKLLDSFAYGRVAVTNNMAYAVTNRALVSIDPCTGAKNTVCTMYAVKNSGLWNAGNGVAYVGDYDKMIRVDLATGNSTSLGAHHFNSAQLEILGSNIFFHYGIEGNIEKCDSNLENRSSLHYAGSK